MSTELIDFVFGAIASGVAGNTAYDGLKHVLGSTFDKLQQLTTDKSKFKDTLLEEINKNKDLEVELNQIQQAATSITNITQSHTGSAENIGRDKVTNNYFNK